MNTIDEPSAGIPRSPQASVPPAADPFREATGRLRAELDETFVALRRTVYVERQILGLSIFDAAFRCAVFACLGATGLAIAIASAWLLVASTRRGLAQWTGGAWWSDLVLALLLALALAGAAHGVRRLVHRSALARTRRGLAQRAESGARSRTNAEAAA